MPKAKQCEAHVLTHTQQRFLAHRLLSESDKEAALAIGIVPQTVAEWKANLPAFRAAYDKLGRDGIELATTMARAMLGKAVERLHIELETAPQARDRIKAAEVLLNAGGMAKNINVQVTPDDILAKLRAWDENCGPASGDSPATGPVASS